MFINHCVLDYYIYALFTANHACINPILPIYCYKICLFVCYLVTDSESFLNKNNNKHVYVSYHRYLYIHYIYTLIIVPKQNLCWCFCFSFFLLLICNTCAYVLELFILIINTAVSWFFFSFSAISRKRIQQY